MFTEKGRLCEKEIEGKENKQTESNKKITKI